MSPRVVLINLLFFVFRLCALSAFVLAAFVLGASPAGAAEGDVYVHAGANFKPVTIAVTPFLGEDAGSKIGGVISNDFARSIFLLPINPSSFPETIANPDVRPNIDAWKAVNAQFVLTGRVLRPDSGHVTAQFRLWDTSTGEQVAGEQYTLGGLQRAPGRPHDRRLGVLARRPARRASSTRASSSSTRAVRRKSAASASL